MQRSSGVLKVLFEALTLNLQGLTPDGFEIRPASEGGYDLILKANSQESGQALLKFLLAIAALANNIMPLNRIEIEGHCALNVSMARLKALWPDETRCLGGVADLALENSGLGEYKLLREAVLQELSSGSLFLLSPQGVYCDVHLSVRADPPCHSDEMVGKAVGHLLGDEAHERLTCGIKLALRDNQSGVIVYPGWVNGEERRYRARIRPIQSLERALLTVDRMMV